MARGSSASLLSLFRLRELDRARSLCPVPGTVLHKFLKPNLSVANVDDNAEVLPHVIAYLDLIHVLFGRAHQSKSALAPLQRSDHLQRLERKRFQRLLAAIEIRRKLAATFDRFDLARLERIGQIERVVGEGLVRLDLRQRVELAFHAFALLLHPFAQVLVAFAAASGDEKHETAAYERARLHFLPFSLASFAALRCLATSSSSRYRKVLAV